MPAEAVASHDRLIARNRRASITLLGVELLVIGAVGAVAGLLIGASVTGLLIGVAVGVGAELAAWLFAVRKTIHATRAVETSAAQSPMLHDVVEGLCLATGLPMPKLYLVDDRAPNAFSFGRSPERAGIAVTSGLLTVMSRRELEGVLAHEISHIRNGDVQIDTLAVTTVGVLAAGADVFARAAWFPDLDGQEADGFLIVLTLALVAALAAFAARLLSLAVVRHREELADASAAAIVSPTGLRKALEKLEADDTVIDHLSRATSHLWIVTPLQRGGPSRRARTNRLFDSHPPIAERIARLRQLEGLDPDQRGPVDLDSSGHVVDLVWHASVPQAIEPADDAPQFADPGYRSRFVTPKPVLRPPVGKPAGWYHVDAKTLRYWQGVIWLDWYAIWDGARWVHQPPGSARPGDGA